MTFADDTTPVGSAAIAVTFSFFRNQGGSLSFEESDIVFSQAFTYSTSAEANKFDIQGVITHEIGHVLGLDHSALVSSVMVPFAAAGQLDQRTLAYDDIAGAVDEVGTGAGTFLTENLWGVGSTAPYMHDGRATTLGEAILEHGGEAQSSASSFRAALEAARTNPSDTRAADLLAMLENLVLFFQEEE